MRYIVLLFCLISISINAQTVTQPGLRDYQLTGATLPDSILYIMGTDTLDGSAKQGLGKWHRADLLSSYFADTDWLKLGSSTAIPTNSDSAYRSGYTLFTGLSGGLATMIEILKDGSINFDYENNSSGETKVYQTVQPLQQTEGNVPWVSSIFTAANYGARFNDVHSMGWNLEGGNVLEAGKQAFGWVCEGWYQQNATRLRFEDHTIWYDTDGVQRRPESLVITDGYYDEWYKYFTVNDLFGLDPRNNYKSFQFALDADTTISKMYLWSPQSANTKAAEFQLNTTTNRLSISPIGTSNSTFDVNAYPFTRAALIQRTEVAATYGLTMATVAGNTSDGYFGNIGIGWGLDLTSGTLLVDSSQVATQYDLTTAAGTNLSIAQSGGTQVIQSSTGTDVGVRNLYGLLITEGATDTLHFRVDSSKIATQYDISGFGTMSNWLLAASGTGGTETITNGETVTVSETTGLDVTRSTNTVSVALSIDEFTTDAVAEGDELLLAYDASGTNHELFDINDLPYLTTEVDGSTTNEIQTLDATGTTTVTWDLSSDASDITLTGAGISVMSRSGNAVTVTSTEVDGSTTNEAWTIDADDADTEVISNQTVTFEGLGGIATNYIPATNTLEIDGSGISGTDTHFGADNLTWTGNRTHNESTYTTTIQGSAMAWKFEDTDATAGPSITLEGNVGNSDAPFGTIAFQYSDSGFATDQAAWTMVANRETNDQEHSTFEITANEATAAPPVMVFEENQNLSDNTQETFIQLNGGIAKTQYWESTTSNAITLDRGYYNVALLTGHTGTITLPEIYGINEANTEVSATLVPIGQEYVITNLSGSTVTIAAINNTGTANDDWLNNTEGGTYPLNNGNSIIVKATTIVSNEGHWFIY